MAEDIKRKFERGDFLTKKNKKGSFMIFEGNNLSDSAYKRLTLVCIYDPEKYVMGSVGYEQQPTLEVASKHKPCIETIDTDIEDYWISICTDEQKEDAINILAQYGLYWNEDTLELVEIETGEVVRKVVIPDNIYHGQVIKPSSEHFRNLAKKYCANKIAPTAYYSQNWDEEYYD